MRRSTRETPKTARLVEYGSKRRPGRTPEPPADRGSVAGGADPIFVVQRHSARRLHYDLRLEREGVLSSWAVPKGIPTEPGSKRLAVRVEDHPLAYADFEGEIPGGEYGAGTVQIWDRGTYDLVEEKVDGGLTVRLKGGRLAGLWTLVPAGLDGDERNWLLVRKRDSGASEARSFPRYGPMLATLVESLPAPDGWLFEVKWDGYRVLARLRGGEATLWSRSGKDLTERFSPISRALPRAVRSPDCVLDGEVCALDAQGRPKFALLQSGGGALVYQVFDLLELDGRPLLDLPLAARREELSALLEPANPAVRLSEAFEDGEALLAAVRAERLEGVIAKRVGSPYQEGKRSPDWLKVKPRERQEFVIAGFTSGSGRHEGSLGALVLAVRHEGVLEWVGNCGTGFTADERDRLLRRLRPLRRRTTPFGREPRMPRVRRGEVTWVTPRLVCEVEFAEWTRDGRLRAPSYRGLREDKTAEDVRRERADERVVRRGRREVRLRNLQKAFWPEGITKGDLLEYYERIGPELVPHLRNRPFTMKRYPDGIQGDHFFQKDAPRHMPTWIPTRALPATSRDGKGSRTIRYPLVNDELALLWMANMGCIDLNVTLSRVDRLDRPDAVLFDLDPAADAGFPEVVRVALLVGEVLDALDLVGYAKTSGADGMHVLVPVSRRHTFEDTRTFATVVAGTLARLHPGLVTTEFLRERRRGVLIDANQNRAGATIASVYSVRPEPGAPVSTPLHWEELSSHLRPGDFTMSAVLDRVDRLGDLFAPVLSGHQSLSGALRSLGEQRAD